MYKKIAIIGLGTIGGFLSKNISETEEIEELVLIDYDTVASSNLKNSIYKKSDVGKFKVDCISSIIHKLNSDIKIIAINDKYTEGKTKIPECDLVIDCRDFIYDRGSEIDIRLYISSRYLVIDCRKDTKYQLHYEGKYIDNLTKSDINTATFNFTHLLSHSKIIDRIIKGNLVHKIELDFLKHLTTEALSEYENKKDIIVDSFRGDEKLINFFENSEEIIDKNQRHVLNICLGSVEAPIATKTIPINQIKTESDLMQHILTVTQFSSNFNHYIISPMMINKQYYIILIPETGAA